MRKILFIFILLFTNASVCFASHWFTMFDKSYLDLESLKVDGQYVYGWIKRLNPGDWELENNKKVYSKMIYYVADCSGKKLDTIAVITYGGNNQVLSSFDISANYNPRYGNWFSVAPETYGEATYQVLCSSITQ